MSRSRDGPLPSGGLSPRCRRRPEPAVGHRRRVPATTALRRSRTSSQRARGAVVVDAEAALALAATRGCARGGRARRPCSRRARRRSGRASRSTFRSERRRRHWRPLPAPPAPPMLRPSLVVAPDPRLVRGAGGAGDGRRMHGVARARRPRVDVFNLVPSPPIDPGDLPSKAAEAAATLTAPSARAVDLALAGLLVHAPRPPPARHPAPRAAPRPISSASPPVELSGPPYTRAPPPRGPLPRKPHPPLRPRARRRRRRRRPVARAQALKPHTMGRKAMEAEGVQSCRRARQKAAR